MRRPVRPLCPACPACPSLRNIRSQCGNRRHSPRSYHIPKLVRLLILKNPEVVIAPPSLYLLLAREHLREGIEVAAQNIFDKPNGAFTGELSAEQIRDSGIGWVLAGHSERRVILGEDDKVSGS